jgi:hypothetical protein
MMMKTGIIASAPGTNTDFLPATYGKHLNLAVTSVASQRTQPDSISAASDLQLHRKRPSRGRVKRCRMLRTYRQVLDSGKSIFRFHI